MANQKDQKSDSPEENVASDVAQLKDLMFGLQKTLIAAPALNGGFDKLVNEVDNLVANQHKIISKMDSIHQSIFEPDEGLYTRIRDLDQWRKAHEEKEKELKQAIEDVQSLKNWKEQEKNDTQRNASREEEITEALKKIQLHQIWKENANKALWLISGTMIMVVIKGVWDFVGTHIILK